MHHSQVSAALAGDLDAVVRLYGTQGFLDPDVIKTTVLYNHDHILDWIYRLKLDPRFVAARYAALVGNLDLLGLVLSSEGAVAGCRIYGSYRPDVVRFMHKRGCALDDLFMVEAMSNLRFKLELLALGLSYGAELTDTLVFKAAAAGDLVVLEWLAVRGCPMHPDAVPAAMGSRDPAAVAERLLALGCKRPDDAALAVAMKNHALGKGMQQRVFDLMRKN